MRGKTRTAMTYYAVDKKRGRGFVSGYGFAVGASNAPKGSTSLRSQRWIVPSAEAIR